MTSRLQASAAAVLAAVALAACGSSATSSTILPPQTSPTATTPATPPGQGRPQVTIGDKNYTEQFVLGELYYEALQAQGFSVLINQNIGPTQVTMKALQSGQLNMYPEYLNVWNSQIAGLKRRFRTERGAYRAARAYARTQGLELLKPTPFSDTTGLGVTVNYAQENQLRSLGDLAVVAPDLTIGGPPQFQTVTPGLPDLERAYSFTPAAFKSLEIGNQYKALDQATVQAAYVNTTDGEFTTGNYKLLADPKRVLGIGNVVPVVSAQTLAREGPAFAATINRVSALLKLPVIRELNAQVDLSGQTPAGVASRFLADHGLIPPASVVS